MGDVYHSSTLSDAQIQAALSAIFRVIDPSNNGKVLCVGNDGKIVAKSASAISGDVNLQAKIATVNGIVLPDAGYDGLSQVTVDVSGGGGGGGAIWQDALSFNWDFSDPVNTREGNSYSSSSLILSIDGWQLQGGTLDFDTGGIRLSRYASGTAGYFMQKFKETPTRTLAGKTSTISVIVDGDMYTMTDVFPTSNSSGTFGFDAGGIYIRVWRYNNNEAAITIDIGTDTQEYLLQALKLEAGSTQTLASQISGEWVLNQHMSKNNEAIRVNYGAVYNS